MKWNNIDDFYFIRCKKWNEKVIFYSISNLKRLKKGKDRCGKACGQDGKVLSLGKNNEEEDNHGHPETN